MKRPAWLLLCLTLLLLAIVLLLAPPKYEGPTLVRLDPRHAITGMDLVALVPLAAGFWVTVSGLVGGPKPSGAAPAALPLYTFLAGLALGLAVAARFSFLAIHWPLAVGMLLLVILMGLFMSGAD